VKLIQPPLHVLLAFAIFLIFLGGPQIVGIALGNIGGILLVRDLNAPSQLNKQRLVYAKNCLILSTNLVPERATIQRALGYVVFLEGDMEEALYIWRKTPGSEVWLLSRGITAYRLSAYEEARLWLDTTTQVKPDLGKAWYYLGLSYNKLEQPEKAWEALRLAEEQADSQPIISSIYHSQGDLLADTSAGLPEALRLYDMALDADRFIEAWRRRDAYYAQGEVLLQLGQYDEAIQSFQAVLALYNDHYWARVRLGRAIWLASGSLEDAERYYLEAIDLNPSEKSAYRWLALTYQEAGQIQEATIVYRKVLEIDPEDKMALEFLGEAP